MRNIKVIQPILTMKWNDHLLYWGYLLVLSFVLIILYFQGSPWMQELAAPIYNREFGLVENAQNLMLLFTAYLAFRLLMPRRQRWIRIGYLLIFATVVFTFLEEIDYGFHYINYLNDADLAARSINHNIHNTPNTNNRIRLIFYMLILLFVIILPYFPSTKLPALLKHFVPTIRLQLTVLAFLVISQTVGIFNRLSTSTNMVLHGNLSEFEELCLYYLVMLYVYRLYCNERNAFPGAPTLIVTGEKLAVTKVGS